MADLYPPITGWLQCDDQYTTSVTLNSTMISPNPADFPMAVRIHMYDRGAEIADWVSPELQPDQLSIIKLNELLHGRVVHDGYFEVTVVPSCDEAMKRAYFNEVWAQVYTRDGRTAVEFPLLIGRGADPSMIDSSYLYYPGVVNDAKFRFSLMALNHQTFANEYVITLYSPDGTQQRRRHFHIAAKSLCNHMIDEAFPDAGEVLRDGPGMLVFHFKYKMNAFVQCYQRARGILSGMDHVGLLFGSFVADDMMNMLPVAEPDLVHAQRQQDRLVCYCKKVTESRVRAMHAEGQTLHQIQSACGAGTVCLGCVGDLEQLVGELSERTKNWNQTLWDLTATPASP